MQALIIRSSTENLNWHLIYAVLYFSIEYSPQVTKNNEVIQNGDL